MIKKALALLLFTLPLLAQPKPVDVKVQSVNDRRSASFGQLRITMQLPKVMDSQVAASRTLVRTAVDDTGTSLLDEGGSEPEMEPNARAGMVAEGRPDEPVTVSVSLKNPSRKATKVKEVRGEVELFMPSRDPNSVAEIAKFRSFSGKAITHKALKANGVEILLLSPKQIEAERKKIADAKRKEYLDAGYEAGEDLENNIRSQMEYTLTVEPNDIPVRVKDPNKRIQELEYVDGAGEVKRVFVRNLHEDIGAITTWGDPPGADWKLRVKMKTQKNVVRHSFVLEDIALP